MPVPTFQVVVDWEDNGDFSDANDDITADIRNMTFGHQRDIQTEDIDAADVSLELNNEGHKYSAPNSSGPLFGDLVAGREMWIRQWYPFDQFVGVAGTDLDAHEPTNDINWAWVNPTTRGFELDGSNNARTEAAGAGVYHSYIEFNDNDVTIAANITIPASGGDGGMLFRYTSTSNFLYVQIFGAGGSNNIQFHSVIATVDTQEAQGTFVWNTGDTHFIVIELHGDQVRVIIDNVEVIKTTFADAAVNDATKHGLYASGESQLLDVIDFGGFKSLFFGRIDKIQPRPEKQKAYAYISAFDDGEQMRRTEMRFANTLSTSSPQRSDQMLGDVLSSFEFDTGRRLLDTGESLLTDIDTGLQPIESDGLEAVNQLRREEDGHVYIDGMGFVRLENRTHRTTAPHTIVKSTIRDVPSGDDMVFSDLEWSDGNDSIENLIIVRTQRSTKASEKTVWTHTEATSSPDSTLSLANAETQDFLAEIDDDDAADGWIAPENTSDQDPTASVEDGAEWTNETNVFLSDDNRADYAGTGQADLRVTNFPMFIPSGATILGIEVFIEGFGDSGTSTEREIDLDMTKDGSARVGSTQTDVLNQSADAQDVVGSETDLWGTT